MNRYYDPTGEQIRKSCKGCSTKNEAEEIEQFLQRNNFSSEMFYAFFTLSLSAGLRLGEARGFRACQFLEDKQAVIVDVFLLPDGDRQSFCKTGSDKAKRRCFF